MSSSVAALPPAALVAVVLLGAAQLTLQVAALVRLLRTPARLLQFGSRWPWLAIILLGSLAGAIVFLAVGRIPTPVADPGGLPAAPVDRRDAVTAAVDLLYPPLRSGERS